MIEIEKGFFMDKNGVVYKDKNPVPVHKDKDGYKFIYIYINGKRWQRYLAKIVAIHLVQNPHNYKFLIFKDNDKNNCCPENLAWISNKQDAVKRKIYDKWRAKKIEYSKEYAIENSKTDLLKTYYSTGDISVINKEVEKIYSRVGDEVKKTMGWSYLYILDRLERNSIFGDLQGYFIKLHFFFNREELKSNPAITLYVSQLEEQGYKIF